MARAFQVLILVCIVSSIGSRVRGAVTTTAPATQAANVWLEEAEHDIAALPIQTPPALVMVQPHVLATDLYMASATPERRLLALRRMDEWVATRVGERRSAESVRNAYMSGAQLHALMEDKPGARSYLRLADTPSALPPTTNPDEKLATAWVAQSIRLEVYLLLGEQDAIAKMDLDESDVVRAGAELEHLHHPQEAAAAAALLHSRFPEQKARHASPPSASAMRGHVRDLARAGRYTEAMQVAKEIEVDLPPSAQPDAAQAAFSAYVVIADLALNAEDVDAFHQAISASLDVLKNHPAMAFWDITRLLELCVAAKDRQSFEAAARRERAALERRRQTEAGQSIEPVASLAHLALLEADIDDKSSYAALAEQVEQELASPADATAPPQARADRDGQRAATYLRLAAARARSGDSSGADQDIARANQLAKPSWDQMESQYKIAEAYADAGLFDRAIAAAKLITHDSVGLAPSYIARREAEAGRFDDAWALSASVPQAYRWSIQYWLAVRQVQTGHEADLRARLDKVPTPQERALLELAAGRPLLGKPFEGTYRSARPKL